MDNVGFRWLGGPQTGILVIDGLVGEETVGRLLEKIAPIYATTAKQGRTLGGLDTATKYSMDLGLSEHNAAESGYEWDEEYADIEQSLTLSLTIAVNYYKSKVRSLYSWNDIEDTGFNIQMYPAYFGRYVEHVDSSPADTRSISRVLAALFYLNDVDLGGETSFPDHGLEVKPRAGRLVLFPALWTHTHKAEVPLSGDKWIINTFLVSGTAMNMVRHYEARDERHHHHDHEAHHDHQH
jgi:hypothetical protein